MPTKLKKEEELILKNTLYKDLIVVLINLFFLTNLKSTTKEDKIIFINSIIKSWNERLTQDLDKVCNLKGIELSKFTEDPSDVSKIMMQILSTEQCLIKDDLVCEIQNILTALVNE